MSLRSLGLATLACVAFAMPRVSLAQPLYADPGWDHFYDGDSDSFGVGDFGALDGTFQHDQADRWDGSAPGVGLGAPGGVDALVEGDATYLRIQDTGKPTEWGFPDPSNRRIWFGHDIEDEHPGATSVLTNGITITFRARLSSTGVLDPIYPQITPDLDPEQPALTEITPWFPKGYNVTDDGQGMFTVQEDGVNAVGFALALDLDTPAGVPGGLVMNAKPGVTLPGSDHVGLANSNFVQMDDADLLDWHEFWITIAGAETPGTYEIDVYRDGSVVPAIFVARNSNGAEYPGQYFAFGLSATSGFGAFDVDFYAYKLGVHVPVPEPAPEGAALAAFVATWIVAQRRRA